MRKNEFCAEVVEVEKDVQTEPFIFVRIPVLVHCKYRKACPYYRNFEPTGGFATSFSRCSHYKKYERQGIEGIETYIPEFKVDRIQ